MEPRTWCGDAGGDAHPLPLLQGFPLQLELSRGAATGLARAALRIWEHPIPELCHEASRGVRQQAGVQRVQDPFGAHRTGAGIVGSCPGS